VVHSKPVIDEKVENSARKSNEKAMKKRLMRGN